MLFNIVYVYVHVRILYIYTCMYTFYSVSLLLGNLLTTVADWQVALQVISKSEATEDRDISSENASPPVFRTCGDITESHVTVDDVTTSHVIRNDTTCSHVTGNDVISDHVTDGHVTTELGEELTVAGLVYHMVKSVGPSLSSCILSSVGGAGLSGQPEKGAELHSLMVQLAAVHSQQRLANCFLCNRSQMCECSMYLSLPPSLPPSLLFSLSLSLPQTCG